jgi:hypothetical protein
MLNQQKSNNSIIDGKLKSINIYIYIFAYNSILFMSLFLYILFNFIIKKNVI